ncbi:MAG: phenylacetate--CoA ligase family protein, partial [Anaerolineales bacterium]
MGYFDEALETMPREALQAVQLEKLQELLDVVCSRNRFYRAKFEAAGVDSSTITSVADLRALPFTTKDELLQAQSTAYPLGANATYPETEYTRIHQTSGTTGTPLRGLDTDASWNRWGRCWGFV